MASPLNLDNAAGADDGYASDIDCDLVEYTLPLGDSSMRPPGHSEYAADADSVRPPNCTVPIPFLTLADQAKHTSVGGSNMLAGRRSGDSGANSRSTTMVNPAAKPGGGGGGGGGVNW